MRLARLAALVAILAVAPAVRASDATYPSDESFCPHLHEHIECRAAGDCEPYNYTDRGDFWDVYEAASPSTLTIALDTCRSFNDTTSCDGNSLCQWVEIDSNNFTECYPKHTEIIDIITDDGAPASWIGLMRLYWNECWYLDATECENAARCAMFDFGDNFLQCFLTKEVEVAIAAVGCRKTQSFAEVAQTWGVDLDATISNQITASTSCGSVSDPAHGENVNCHIMLDGDVCVSACDVPYVREWGNSTSKCSDGAYTPATCRKLYTWSDDAFCPAMKDGMECDALGTCGDDFPTRAFSDEMFDYQNIWYTLNPDTLWRLQSSLDADASAFDLAYHECSSLNSGGGDPVEGEVAEQCAANSKCVWGIWKVTDSDGNVVDEHGWCDPRGDVVTAAVTADGAPASYVAYISWWWHDCWFLSDDSECLADRRCQHHSTSHDLSTSCSPSNETRFRTATAACAAHASFDAVQTAYGLSYPGKIGCQRVCEGWDVTKRQCDAKPQCEWFVDRCVSASSGNGACSGDAPGAASAPDSAPPTRADVNAKKEVAKTKRADADTKRRNAEAKRDDLLTSIGDARDRRLAELFANAALAGASAIAKIGGLQLAAADEDAACDAAFAKMGLEATEGACDVATFAAGRKRALLSARDLLATYDVSVYLDPARVDSTALDALVLTLSSAGFAPTTATSDPVSELSSIPGIDSGLFAAFKTNAAVAVEAEAAAVEAEAIAEDAERSLSGDGQAATDGESDEESGADVDSDAGDAPPPLVINYDYESSGRRTPPAVLAVLAAFVCAAAFG